MILDLGKFIQEERPFWSELEAFLQRLANEPGLQMDLPQVKRFHYLYQRTSADLARINTFSAEPRLRSYLESLVARAFGEIHETREKIHVFRPVRWFFREFPQTFRRHFRAFVLAWIVMFGGFVFGGAAIGLDPGSKDILLPFSHLRGNPSERVALEESRVNPALKDQKARFSSYLITHNTRVSIFTLSLGMTWGVGTVVLLFTNGVILGAVALDYLLAGQGVFLLGWLLPHGSVEIPAILLAGQAGLVLGGALIGWGTSVSLKVRLKRISRDLTTLIGGIGILLVWAGIVEGFFSQFHEPVVPYMVKIGFGATEIILLTLFLWRSGGSNRQGAQT